MVEAALLQELPAAARSLCLSCGGGSTSSAARASFLAKYPLPVLAEALTSSNRPASAAAADALDVLCDGSDSILMSDSVRDLVIAGLEWKRWECVRGCKIVSDYGYSDDVRCVAARIAADRLKRGYDDALVDQLASLLADTDSEVASVAGSAVVDACGVKFNQKIVDTLHKLHANGDSVVRLRVLHFLALLSKKNHQCNSAVSAVGLGRMFDEEMRVQDDELHRLAALQLAADHAAHFVSPRFLCQMLDDARSPMSALSAPSILHVAVERVCAETASERDVALESSLVDSLAYFIQSGDGVTSSSALAGLQQLLMSAPASVFRHHGITRLVQSFAHSAVQSRDVDIQEAAFDTGCCLLRSRVVEESLYRSVFTVEFVQLVTNQSHVSSVCKSAVNFLRCLSQLRWGAECVLGADATLPYLQRVMESEPKGCAALASVLLDHEELVSNSFSSAQATLVRLRMAGESHQEVERTGPRYATEGS